VYDVRQAARRMIRPRSVLAARVLVVDAVAVVASWAIDVVADGVVAGAWWIDERLRRRG